MGNVEYVPRNKLGEKESIIVDTFDYAIDNLPVTIRDFDPTVREMVTGMKFIIDSGWTGKRNIFARKVKCKDEFDQIVTGVMLTDDETDFAYDVRHGYSEMLKDSPTVIGLNKRNTNSNEPYKFYDGDVLLKESFGHYISLGQWEEIAHQRSKRKID